MTSVHPMPHAGDGYDASPPGAVPDQEQFPPPSAAWTQPVTTQYYQAATGGAPPSTHGTTTTAVAIPLAEPLHGVVTIKHEPDQDPANRIETGRWSAGLCDCCNNCVPNLFMTWCCPCVALAQVYARVALGRYFVVLARLLVLTVVSVSLRFVLPTGGSSDYTARFDANGNFVIERASGLDLSSTVGSAAYALLQIAFAMHVFHARRRIRQRFQIPGNCCCDCVVSWCCSCCAIAQMATHVKSYTPGDCSFDTPDVLPAYASNP